MVELYRVAKNSKSCNIKKWLTNRKASFDCKVDIEALFEWGNNPGSVDYENALDELLAVHGTIRVLYLLHLTTHAVSTAAYGSKELEFVEDMAEIYSLTWLDPSENNFDFQFAYALDVADVSGWNKLANALYTRLEEESSGKIYVVVEANNVNMDIAMSKPFATHRKAWKLMKSIYDELRANGFTDASISQNAYTVFYGEGSSVDVYYGEIKTIEPGKSN